MSRFRAMLIIGIIAAAFTFTGTGSTHAQQGAPSAPLQGPAAAYPNGHPPATPYVYVPAGAAPPICPGNVPCGPLTRPTSPPPPPPPGPRPGPTSASAPRLSLAPSPFVDEIWPSGQSTDLASPGGRRNDLVASTRPLTDANSPGCCKANWAYQLGAGQGNSSNAFSSYIYASAGGNFVPSAYNVEDFQWLGGFDQSDGAFVQIGYGTNQSGQEFLFGWSTDPAGTTCDGNASHYLGTTYFGPNYCVATFSAFGVTDSSWIYFWMWEDNGTDQLYVGNSPFAHRTAAYAANFNGVLDTAEVSTGANYDMQNDLIAHGLGLYGYYDQFAGWNGSGWSNQTPLYADNSQFDFPRDGIQSTPNDNYFGQSPCSPPGGPFGQAEPYGSGSGGYDAGDSSSQCVSNGAQVPGS